MWPQTFSTATTWWMSPELLTGGELCAGELRETEAEALKTIYWKYLKIQILLSCLRIYHVFFHSDKIIEKLYNK